MELTSERLARMQAFRAEIDAERREQSVLEALPIRELLTKRLELAPRLSRLPVRSLPELAEAFGATPETMADAVRRQLEEYASSVSESSPQPEEEDLPLFERMYELSVLARDASERTRVPWLGSFRSFETFRRAYLGNVSQRQVTMLRCQIMYATEHRVRPERVMLLRTGPRHSWQKRDRSFEASGSWALLPNRVERFKDEFEFVESGVLNEIVSLLESGYRPSDYSHASGSAALWAIGRQGVIRSSAELIQRGRPPRTGEAGGGRHQGGLWNVYGDRGVREFGSYNTISWFDEYFVTFGINGARQEEFLNTLGPEDWRVSAYESLLGPGWDVGKGKIVDFGGEGNLLGPRVPLSSVDTVYAWKSGESDVRAWLARFAPHARFVSLEANATLQRSGPLVNALAIQEGLSPADAWRSLKRHAVTIE